MQGIIVHFQFDDPLLEESLQAAEYDAFFNSDDKASSVDAYALESSDAVVEQLKITNGLLGIIDAFLIIAAIWAVMKFFMQLLSNTVFNQIY